MLRERLGAAVATLLVQRQELAVGGEQGSEGVQVEVELGKRPFPLGPEVGLVGHAHAVAPISGAAAPPTAPPIAPAVRACVQASRSGSTTDRHAAVRSGSMRTLAVMSSRMTGLLSADPAVQALAGDQLYVDLDLSHDNLPAGTRLALGDDAVLEVTAKPHAGCRKFLARFGADAVAFVNGEAGSALRLRGLNARVVAGGVVRPGDVVRRLG